MPLEAPLLISAGALLPLLLRSARPALSRQEHSPPSWQPEYCPVPSRTFSTAALRLSTGLCMIREQGPTLPVVMWPVRIAKFYASTSTCWRWPQDDSVARLDSLAAGGTPFWAVTSFGGVGLFTTARRQAAPHGWTGIADACRPPDDPGSISTNLQWNCFTADGTN